jgi:hypothetical protein
MYRAGTDRGDRRRVFVAIDLHRCYPFTYLLQNLILKEFRLRPSVTATTTLGFKNPSRNIKETTASSPRPYLFSSVVAHGPRCRYFELAS